MSSSDKAQLLFVCKFLPYPPMSGAALRNWEVIQKLSRYYKITLAAFSYPHQQADNLYLYQYVDEILTTTWKPQAYLNIARCYCRGLPLTIARFSDPLLREKIQTWQNKNNLHQVHLSELASAAVLPEESAITVYDAHNIESDLCQQAGKVFPQLIQQLWCSEVDRVIKFEKMIINKSKKITCVSQEDSRKVKQFSDETIRESSIIVLPNGTNVPKIVSDQEKFNLLFVGQSGWHANHYALCWFIKSVWVKVKAMFPNARFTIVGGKAKKSLIRLIQSYNDIYLHENVTSVKPYLRQASAAVSPLLYGSGTSLKILEYAAYKVPIVCTSIAIRGLPFDNQNVWICETADDFVRSLTEVWSDSSKSFQKVDLSYEIVKTHFDWNITLNGLIGNDEDSCVYPFSTQ
jgi:polysaccharide biosynthesis protein PslH